MAGSGDEVDAASFGQTVSATTADHTNGLRYADYGAWLYTPNGSAAPTQGATYGVALTPTAGGSVPGTGTATYTGGAVGMASTNAAAGGFVGDSSLTANFGTGQVAGSITNIKVSAANDVNHVNAGTMNDITLTGATIAGSNFTGGTTAAGATAGTYMNITGATGAAGSFGGQFAGPTANEAAGTFKLTGGANSAQVIGSFGVKQ